MDLQKAIGAKPDGIWGDGSRKALLNAFTNAKPKPIGAVGETALAARLGVSLKQLRAVARVESSGRGFDPTGKPKLLFERHKFHKYTGGAWSVCAFSNAQGGGYNEDSWNKLIGAIITGAVNAAFMSCSWGKFQVLAQYWDEFGFDSPFAFALSTVAGEAEQYALLARYVELFKLEDELAALSTDPKTCRPFAKAFNGANYSRFHYDTQLAKAMA